MSPDPTAEALSPRELFWALAVSSETFRISPSSARSVNPVPPLSLNPVEANVTSAIVAPLVVARRIPASVSLANPTVSVERFETTALLPTAETSSPTELFRASTPVSVTSSTLASERVVMFNPVPSVPLSALSLTLIPLAAESSPRSIVIPSAPSPRSLSETFRFVTSSVPAAASTDRPLPPVDSLRRLRETSNSERVAPLASFPSIAITSLFVAVKSLPVTLTSAIDAEPASETERPVPAVLPLFSFNTFTSVRSAESAAVIAIAAPLTLSLIELLMTVTFSVLGPAVPLTLTATPVLAFEIVFRATVTSSNSPLSWRTETALPAVSRIVLFRTVMFSMSSDVFPVAFVPVTATPVE